MADHISDKRQEHREKLKLVPKKPGVYLMKNQDDLVIYVGKAKALHNRLSQYFIGEPKDPKTMQMVLHVDHFDYIVTPSEKDALLLENTLIKKYKPKYNILLKDDKTYPFIRLARREDYPYLQLVRKRQNDGSKYYGPYRNAQVVNRVIDLVSKEYRLRSCRADLAKEKKRPCLQYHMGYCSAPCCRKISREEYESLVNEVIRALDSGLKEMLPKLQKKMEESAETLDFEAAAKHRDSLRLIEQFSEKHLVVTIRKIRLDVLYLYRDGPISVISLLEVRDGIINGKKTFPFFDSKNVSDEDMIHSFLEQYYVLQKTATKRIVVATNEAYDIPCHALSQTLSELSGQVMTVSAGRGKFTKKLIEMARANALETIKLRLETKIDDQLFLLKEFLHLPRAPLRIESYDNSNTAGANAVGVMTVWENGVLSQKEKRNFAIQNPNGSDDYAAMREVLDRRFSHLIAEDKGFDIAPDMILVDGGKGQVKTAMAVLEKYGLKIPLYGMVKDDKHRLRDLTDGYRLLDLKSHREVFHFVAKINEQTHKNAISYHKKKTTLTATQSELLSIPDVGMATIKKLYGHFKTLKQIRAASVAQLQEAVTSKAAQNIYNFFHSESSS